MTYDVRNSGPAWERITSTPKRGHKRSQKIKDNINIESRKVGSMTARF